MERGAERRNNGGNNSNIIIPPQVEDGTNPVDPFLRRNPFYQQEGGQKRTMGECLMRNNIRHDQKPIGQPTIVANNFKIKPSMFQMIKSSQFYGLPSKDPITHMSKFIEYYRMLKLNGVSKDSIKLLLFPFSITDRAEKWFTGLLSQSITT